MFVKPRATKTPVPMPIQVPVQANQTRVTYTPPVPASLSITKVPSGRRGEQENVFIQYDSISWVSRVPDSLRSVESPRAA